MNGDPFIRSLDDSLRSIEQHLALEQLLPSDDLETNREFLRALTEHRHRLVAIEDQVARVCADQLGRILKDSA